MWEISVLLILGSTHHIDGAWGKKKSLWQLESNLWSSGRCSHQSVMLFVAENKEHSNIATPTWRRMTICKLWWILGLGNILVLYGHPDLILYIHLVFLVSFNCDMAVLLCYSGFYGLHYKKKCFRWNFEILRYKQYNATPYIINIYLFQAMSDRIGYVFSSAALFNHVFYSDFYITNSLCFRGKCGCHQHIETSLMLTFLANRYISATLGHRKQVVTQHWCIIILFIWQIC